MSNGFLLLKNRILNLNCSLNSYSVLSEIVSPLVRTLGYHLDNESSCFYSFDDLVSYRLGFDSTYIFGLICVPFFPDDCLVHFIKESEKVKSSIDLGSIQGLEYIILTDGLYYDIYIFDGTVLNLFRRLNILEDYDVSWFDNLRKDRISTFTDDLVCKFTFLYLSTLVDNLPSFNLCDTLTTSKEDLDLSTLGLDFRYDFLPKPLIKNKINNLLMCLTNKGD